MTGTREDGTVRKTYELWRAGFTDTWRVAEVVDGERYELASTDVDPAAGYNAAMRWADEVIGGRLAHWKPVGIEMDHWTVSESGYP